MLGNVLKRIAHTKALPELLCLKEKRYTAHQGGRKGDISHVRVGDICHLL
jgi:hypothetical protein